VGLTCGASEVDPAIVPSEDRSVSSQRVVLRLWKEFADFETTQGLHHEGRTDLCESFVDVDRGLFFADGNHLRKEHRARIQSGIESHGGDSGDDLARGYSPLDGCGSAIFR